MKNFKNKAKEIFNSYIETKNLRSTKQRDEIVDAFLETEDHINADQLFEKVKKKDKHIGYATVCRTLKMLCESGIADEFKIGKNKTVYEHKFGHTHHDHLICLKCGEFTEIFNEEIELLQEKVAKENNFESQKHRLEIFGVCKKCK